MGQEDHTLTTGKKGSHFTAEQRTVLEWLWNGKGGKRKERSPTRLAALLGKSQRTIIYGAVDPLPETYQLFLRANVGCYFVIYQVDVDNNMQVIYPTFGNP